MSGKGLTIFGREPIVWLMAIQAVLAIVVNLPGIPLSGETAAWIITIVSALFTAFEAWSVRPVSVAMLTGAVRTSIAAVLLFNVPISDELAGTIVAGVTVVFSLITANSVTPAHDPDPNFTRAAVVV